MQKKQGEKRCPFNDMCPVMRDKNQRGSSGSTERNEPEKHTSHQNVLHRQKFSEPSGNTMSLEISLRVFSMIRQSGRSNSVCFLFFTYCP